MLAASALSIAGCGFSGPSRIHPQAIASDAAAKAMELYDANKDGVLDDKELAKVPGLQASIASFDKNGDGKISTDEINTRIQEWADSKVGRMPVTVTLLHNGKPLEDATVTFQPESFLGGDLKPGTGATDSAGMAVISIPLSDPLDPPGMSPGLYRVQVTKTGENIPAKYNTETTLGQEVGQGNRQLLDGVRFDLKY